MPFPLKIMQLSMQFGQKFLFHIPALEINPATATYLKGENGAGKTTLLKVIAGLTPPSQGKISNLSPWYQNLSAAKLNASVENKKQKKLKVVYLHQTPYLFDASVYVNVAYPIRFNLTSQKQKRKQILFALRLVGLEHLAHQHISVLSGGEKQRVAMARAWVSEPDILLMDEPSASLDQESIMRLVHISQALLSQSKSLVITSHQHNQLTALCQRQWWIKDQQIYDTPLKLEASSTQVNIINLKNGKHYA